MCPLPTSSLSDHEIDNLFEIILRMQKKGITFIYISHRMEEIKRIGNSGTVLRDGKFVASIDDVKSMDMEQIIKLIVGRSLEEQYPARESHIGDVLLDVQGLSVKGLIEDVSFQVRRGEVLGFSGLVGAGRTTTAKAVFGALKKSVGRIFIDGKEVRIRSPHDAIRNGISLLPENRKEEGLVLMHDVNMNTHHVAFQYNASRMGLINHRQEEAKTLQSIARMFDSNQIYRMEFGLC